MRRMVESIRNAREYFSGKGAARSILALIFIFVFAAVLVAPVGAQSPSSSSQRPFLDTDLLISRVAEHQKDVEALFSQYTFTDKTTVYMIDKKGAVRSQPPTLTTTHLHRTRFSLCTSATMANRLRRTTLTGKRRRSSASCKMTNVKLKRIQALAPKTPFCSRTSLSNHNSIL